MDDDGMRELEKLAIVCKLNAGDLAFRVQQGHISYSRLNYPNHAFENSFY